MYNKTSQFTKRQKEEITNEGSVTKQSGYLLRGEGSVNVSMTVQRYGGDYGNITNYAMYCSSQTKVPAEVATVEVHPYFGTQTIAYKSEYVTRTGYYRLMARSSYIEATMGGTWRP